VSLDAFYKACRNYDLVAVLGVSPPEGDVPNYVVPLFVKRH